MSGSYDKTEVINIIKDIFDKLSYKKTNLCIPKLNSSICYNSSKKVHFMKNNKNTNSKISIEFPLHIYFGDKIRLYIPLITNIFGSGLNSLLLKELRNKENLVYGASVTSSTNFCGTLISFSISTIDKNVKEVLEKTFGVLKKYKKTKITKSLLDHFKLRYILTLKDICLNNVESVHNFYSPQYFYQLNTTKPKIYTISDITNIVESTTQAKVLQLCKQLFNFDNCIVCYSSKDKVDFTTNDF